MDKNAEALRKMTGIPASVGICEPIEGYEKRPESAIRAMAEMAERIEAAETELFALKQPQAWIPCEERLPRYSFDYVWVIIKSGWRIQAIRSAQDVRLNPDHYTHWMPTNLVSPAPPETEQ